MCAQCMSCEQSSNVRNCMATVTRQEQGAVAGRAWLAPAPHVTVRVDAAISVAILEVSLRMQVP